MGFPSGTRFPRQFDLWWSTIGLNLYVSHDGFTSCQDRYIFEIDAVESFVQCILDQVDSFGSVGLSSATAMLTIIPTGLALIPTESLGVDEAWDLGVVYFLLSTFAGHIGPGVSAKSMAQNISERTLGLDLYQTYEPKRLLLRGWQRWTFLTFGVVIIAAVMGTVTVLGLQTILTWQADVWWYPLLWVLLRMVPGLVELVLLRIIPLVMQRDELAIHGRRGHTFWLLSIAVYTLRIAGNGIVIIFGTAVLGSLTLMDGATAIKYLFGMPIMYAALQLLLRAGCSKETKYMAASIGELHMTEHRRTGSMA